MLPGAKLTHIRVIRALPINKLSHVNAKKELMALTMREENIYDLCCTNEIER